MRKICKTFKQISKILLKILKVIKKILKVVKFVLIKLKVINENLNSPAIEAHCWLRRGCCLSQIFRVSGGGGEETFPLFLPGDASAFYMTFHTKQWSFHLSMISDQSDQWSIFYNDGT